MPRDLSALKDDAIANMSPLDRSDKPAAADSSSDKPVQGTMFAAQAQTNSKRDNLHPYTQTLTLSDVQSCVILEEAAFPPQERATKEKVSQPLPSPSMFHQRCRYLPHPFACDICVTRIAVCVGHFLQPEVASFLFGKAHVMPWPYFTLHSA